jgi:hypothetical protein
LADYIREAQYDGIRYPSVLSLEGTNVIFFDPGVADVGESKLVRTAETSVRYEEERVRSIGQQVETVQPRPLPDPNG